MLSTSHAHLLAGTPDSMVVAPARHDLDRQQMAAALEMRQRARPVAWQAIAAQLGVSQDVLRRAVDDDYVSPFSHVPPRRPADPAAKAKGRRPRARPLVKAPTVMAGTVEYDALKLICEGVAAVKDIAPRLGLQRHQVSHACSQLLIKGLVVRARTATFAATPLAPRALAKPRRACSLRTRVFYIAHHRGEFGRPRTATAVFCGGCPATSRSLGAPEVAVPKIRAKGWTIGDTPYAHRCPKCAEAA